MESARSSAGQSGGFLNRRSEVRVLSGVPAPQTENQKRTPPLAKHIQSEVKKPDKFLETLTAAWSKAEPYALRIGLAAGALLANIGIWIANGRGRPLALPASVTA